MEKFEYRVIPAPTKAKRGKWVRGAAARFADRLEQIFNEMGAEGWEYVRTDTLPNEERKGLTQTTVTYRNLLVFRKNIPQVMPAVDTTLKVEDHTSGPVALLQSPGQFPETPTNSGGVDLDTDASTDLGAEIIRQQREQAEQLRKQPLTLTDPLAEDAEIIEEDLLPDDDLINSESLAQAMLDESSDLPDETFHADLDVKDVEKDGATGPINIALAARAQMPDAKG